LQSTIAVAEEDQDIAGGSLGRATSGSISAGDRDRYCDVELSVMIKVANGDRRDRLATPVLR